MWLVVLSDQLPIAGLVSHYPTNYLIGRRLLPRRLAALSLSSHAVLASVSQRYPPPQDTSLRVPHPSATARLPQPCDLHVLSMPPAFALSQDQTLRFIIAPYARHRWHTHSTHKTHPNPTLHQHQKTHPATHPTAQAKTRSKHERLILSLNRYTD